MGFFNFFKKKERTPTLEELIKEMKESGMSKEQIAKELESKLGINLDIRSFEDAKLFDWVGITDHQICPDCLERHNSPPKTWEEWEKLGLPGSGNTSCGKDCRCVLVPEGKIPKD